MDKEARHDGGREATGIEEAETRSLLSSTSSTSLSAATALDKPQSPSEPRTPRTNNRVRFQIDEPLSSRSNGRTDPADSQWVEEEDYLVSHAAGGRRNSVGYRLPLLTDIEAPSITVATSDFDAADALENARPKSGMRSAFMNMANSIM